MYNRINARIHDIIDTCDWSTDVVTCITAMIFSTLTNDDDPSPEYFQISWSI